MRPISSPSRRVRQREQWQLLLLVAPYLLGLLTLLLIPLVLAVPLAFTRYDGLSAPVWIGLGNFRQALRDTVLSQSIVATLGLAALAAPVRGLVALGLASLLRVAPRKQRLLRYSVFLPTVMPDVAYALLWLYIFSPLWGPFNWLLPLGGQRPDAWLLEPGPARLAVAITLFWTVGEGIVLLLAAQRAVPRALFEAAALDGAGPLESFVFIAFPLLIPFQILLLCRDIILTIGASFVAAQIITRGGPYYATSYLPYWIYLQSSDFGQLGYAAALNLLLFALTLVAVGALLLLSYRWWRATDLTSSI